MKKDPQKILGENIRRARKAKGLSQEALAEECELHRTYVGAIERGERNITFLKILAVAKSLGVRVAVLFEGLEK